MACRCCIGSSCEPTDEKTCLEIDGKCAKPIGGCFAQSVLYEYLERVKDPVLLLFAGGTFNDLEEVRERLLTSTKLGETLLHYNSEFEENGMALMRKNPGILRQSVHAFLLVASFTRAMLREMNTQGSEKERIWTSECAQRVKKGITKFSRLSDDEAMNRALQHVLDLNRRCTGLSVPAVLELFLSGETFLPEQKSSS